MDFGRACARGIVRTNGGLVLPGLEEKIRKVHACDRLFLILF